MKILVYKWDIFPYDDIIDTMNKQGHDTDVLAFEIKNHIKDDDFNAVLSKYLENNSYDLVFSVNYFTTISNICHIFKIRYISWTCDAPLLSLRNPSVTNPENTIYIFDREEYNYFYNKGIKTVHYLPLAGAPERVAKILSKTTFINTKINEEGSHEKYKYSISFVGNLYDKNRYDEMENILPDYFCGYMDAAIEAQLNVSGGNLLKLMLTDDILNNIEPYIRLEKDDTSTSDIKLHFATSVLSYKTAARMRTMYLNTLGQIADIHLFTTSDTSALHGVNIHPPVKYLTEMPLVFASTKININMTIPNIENGAPLRIFDIISAGGFVLTDYRPEICELFIPGKEIAVYDSIEDMTAKAAYYLKHSDERELIAENGYKKLCNMHTYTNRIKKILSV